MSLGKLFATGYSQPDGYGQFESFGSFAQQVASAGMTGAVSPSLRPAASAPGIEGSQPSAGGFLIPTPFWADLQHRITTENQVIQRCRRRTLDTGKTAIVAVIDESSRAVGSRWGGAQAYWVHEAGLITDSRPKIAGLEFPLSKVCCLVYVTDDLLEDCENLDAYLTDTLSRELAFELMRFCCGKDVFRVLGGAGSLGLLSGGPLQRLDADAVGDLRSQTRR